MVMISRRQCVGVLVEVIYFLYHLCFGIISPFELFMELRIDPEENYRLISVGQGAIYWLSMTSKLDDTSAVANPGLHVPQHKFETETSSL
jgi:hypothetical protein